MSLSDDAQALVPISSQLPGTAELSPGRSSTGGGPALVLAASEPSSEQQLVPHFDADAATAANALIGHKSVYVGDANGLAESELEIGTDGGASPGSSSSTSGAEDFDRRAVTEVLACGDGSEG